MPFKEQLGKQHSLHSWGAMTCSVAKSSPPLSGEMSFSLQSKAQPMLQVWGVFNLQWDLEQWTLWVGSMCRPVLKAGREVGS